MSSSTLNSSSRNNNFWFKLSNRIKITSPLSKFYNTKFFENGKARSLMANLIALMSVNWVFLFGITYGAYEWDVGEPLSYLTFLAVELIAMLGIFSMNDFVERTGKEDWKNIATRMNLESLLRTREYLIAYSKRHF